MFSTTVGASTPIFAVDLNGNQKLDLFTAGLSTSGLDTVFSVMKDNGAMGFLQPAVSTVAGIAPEFIAAGDFDTNGTIDLLVIGANTGTAVCCKLGVLPGNGSGGFGSVTTPTVGTAITYNDVTALLAQDLNGDGKVDLMIGGDIKMGAGADLQGILVALNSGSNVFTITNFNTFNFTPAAIRVADFNQDQIPDIIAVSDAASGNQVYLLLGNGDGTYQGVRSFAITLNGPSNLVVADMNQDGKLDAVISSTSDKNVRIFFGDGMGNLQLGTTLVLPQVPSEVTVGELNGDGRPDVVVAFGSIPVRVYLNTP